MIIGVDVGGTKIAAAAVRRGRTSTVHVRPTQATRRTAAVLQNIADTIQLVSQGKNVSAIGVGVAGIVDWRHGIVSWSANFGNRFSHIRVADYLSHTFHCPVTLDNDANVFALGEALHGAGRQYRNVVGVTVGTGVGAGIIFNREIYHGKNNLAGEIGFIIQDRGRTLEQLASGTALRRQGQAAVAKQLGDGLFSLLTTLDPDCIVVGGGVSRERGLVAKARQQAYSHVYYGRQKHTPILESELKEQAAILGAAELASRLL